MFVLTREHPQVRGVCVGDNSILQDLLLKNKGILALLGPSQSHIREQPGERRKGRAGRDLGGKGAIRSFKAESRMRRVPGSSSSLFPFLTLCRAECDILGPCLSPLPQEVGVRANKAVTSSGLRLDTFTGKPTHCAQRRVTLWPDGMRQSQHPGPGLGCGPIWTT